LEKKWLAKAYIPLVLLLWYFFEGWAREANSFFAPNDKNIIKTVKNMTF
jgi:hypothetical protein